MGAERLGLKRHNLLRYLRFPFKGQLICAPERDGVHPKLENMANKTHSLNNMLLPALLLLLLAAFCFTFFSVWKSLVNLWLSSDEYSHGFFIVPLSLFIVWQKRKKLSTIPIKSSWTGLFISVIALILFLIGVKAHVLTLKPLSMILFIAGAIAFLFGPRILKELSFPLFILFFMIPVPSQVFSAATIHLQLLVSKTSSDFVSLLGISLYREGNVIHLPDKTLQVVRACSGMRSLISLLTLSAVFGYFTLQSNLLRTVLFFSGIPIAVFVNIVRVALLIGFIHFWGIDLSAGAGHTYFGLAVFALALVLLFMVRELIGKWDSTSPKD